MSLLRINFFAGIVIFYLLTVTTQCFGIDQETTSELYKTANEINKNLPMMISDEVLLEKIYVRDNNELVYVVKSNKIDENLYTEPDNLKSNTAKGLCSGSDTAYMLKLGIIFTTVVYDKNDNYRYEFSITEKDCISAANNGQKSNNDFRDSLQASADEIKKNLPMMVDKDTRLDSLSVADGTMIFIYTLVNLNADEVTEDMKDFLTNQAVNGYFSALGEAKLYRDNGVPIKIHYRGKDGKFAAYVSVSPANCK